MMNNTTLENTSLLLLCDIDVTMIASLTSLILRLPVNIYILRLIISRHWITSEFYILNEAIFEVIISLYDFLGLFSCGLPNIYLKEIRKFLLGFIVAGRPCLLTLICVDRYLAVVKPVVFLKLKPLKYKLALSGIIWVWTLVFCLCSILINSFYNTMVGEIIMCCVVKLYCCIATLLVLKKPRPGDGVRQREGMSKIKLKAFRIVLIITVSVIFMYVPLVIFIYLEDYFSLKHFLAILNVCYICTAISGFVQALLFLQRSVELSFIKCP